MGRYKGTFQNPANYEPLIAAPFDARTLVDTKADLIAAKTWQQKNGDLWIYEGMEVIVKDEHCSYILNNPISYFLESSWTKGAKYEDIVALEKKIGAVPEGTTLIDLINAIEGGGGGYDDTAITQQLEKLEETVDTLDKDVLALRSLVGNTSVADQITAAIDTLAPIARTGDINDLTQQPNEYVVLTCGSSDE